MSWNGYFRRLADRLTVRQQTAMMTGLLCIATVGIVTAGAALMARRQAISDANLELAAMAQTMSSRLDQNMFERYREIKNIANLEPLRGAWTDDPAKARGVLGQLQSGLEDYAWLGLAAPDGTVRAATRGMLEGVSVAQRPWFGNGLKGATVEDVHDAKLLDQLLRRSPDEAPFRFVDVAMPVFGANGALAGVLGAHLSWNWASEVRSKVLQRYDSALESDIWVLGREGNVLLGPQTAASVPAAWLQAVRSGRPAIFRDMRGERPMLITLVATRGEGDYPGLGWIVASRRPLDVALAPANRLALAIGLLGTLIAALGAALAWFLAGTVTGPLTRLCRAIDLIGRDPQAHGVERQHGSRDLLQLSGALRSLLRRLGTAERGVQEARETIREVEQRAEEQARAADEKTRRLGSDIHTLRALADTDPLTGLFNRRAFLPFAEDAMNYFKRYKRHVGVLMFDIDHFKRVNDTFGHAAGDEVIRAVGKIIAGQVRATDKVARFGGEEFVVLLRETDDAGATLLANRIREAVENTVVTQGLAHLSITISIGAAMASPRDRDIEDVIARADAALYQAKSAGRNRVVMAQSEPIATEAA
ncbi:MAG TPA: sensor domain-containing diguanylate cyclase [Bosea sp. (in: a-proteobacteria)]|uniref:sensor domain-containing diguanylate cyclase n=1 Tax=Bosea sp. (in: a-proteobacteria) TaxID=1871050 RepID=UPI002E135A88|nr:sensor domain-containing diguanylate cyclase [Bosea sp. (in: a-proteobacteria)]